MSGHYCPAPDAIIAALGPAQAVLYGRIWRYCQGGGTCYASAATLARECGISTKTVGRWVADLVGLGYITAESGRDSGKTSVIRTTRLWVMGGDSDTGGRTESPRGVGQRVLGGGTESPTKIEGKIEGKDRVASPRSAQSKPKGATREPRPLFDAFKGSFPTAPDSVAGRFDKECNRLGYTLEQWRRFMADRETADQMRRGFITQNNALGRFAGWIAGSATPAARVQAPRPPGAPDHWRDLIYTHDGTRKAPALILPALGLDRYAPPDQWPEWLRSFESEGVMA